MATSIQTPSIALTIQIAWASMVYAGRDIQKKAFRSNEINDSLAIQLWFAASVLEWSNANGNPGGYDLKAMRNYTLMLCGQYIVEAQTNIGSGGVVIIPTIAPVFNWRWVTSSFTVGLSGSPVSDGELSFTITEDNIAFDSVAFGFSNSSPLPRTGTVPSGQQTYSVTYSTTAITITLAQAVIDGEQYTLTYVRLGGTQAFTPGGTSLPSDVGHEGEVLFTDGSGNQYWGDVLIEVTGSDFESDGITLNDTRMEHNNMAIYWMQGGFWLDSTQFTRLIGGGFTINIDGFNATLMQTDMKVILKGLNS